jgi:hypothetical protein
MKRIIFITLLLTGIILNAQDVFYVATDGSDSNPGTIGQPWRTWAHAFSSSSVTAGDTVYFRGGVYQTTVTTGGGIGVTRGGNSSNWVYYWAYPGETPILDCSNVTPTGDKHYGIRSGTHYVHFKGLTLRNVWEVRDDVFMQVYAWGADSYQIFENCAVYNIGGVAFDAGFYQDDGYIRYINCDAYNCVNPLAPYPGGKGTGFSHINVIDDLGTIYYIGCRAWKCSDQGWSMDDATIIIDSCWAFNNGFGGAYQYGDGHGFKLGWVDLPSDSIRRIITNSISAYNSASGVSTNDNGYDNAVYAHIYNNTFYHNSTGIIVAPTDDTDAHELRRIYRNNIAYANTMNALIITGALYTHDHNSWDGGVTVSNNDFVSVDSTGLSGARQADGTLPVLNFLKLAATSDLINAGVDIGLDFEGAAPDMGAYEYDEFAEEPSAPYIATTTPYAITANSAKSGGYMISDGGGTISTKGVCWATTANPDLTDTVITGGTGTDDFTVTISGLVVKTTYHVRAYATNETGTTYGADESFTTSQSSIIKHGGKIVKR